MPRKKYIKNKQMMQVVFNKFKNGYERYRESDISKDTRDKLEELKRNKIVNFDSRDFYFYVALKLKTLDYDKIIEGIDEVLTTLSKYPEKSIHEFLNVFERKHIEDIDTSTEKGCMDMLLRNKLAQLGSKILRDNPEQAKERFKDNPLKQKYYDFRTTIETGVTDTFQREFINTFHVSPDTFKNMGEVTYNDEEILDTCDSKRSFQDYIEGKKDYVEIAAPSYLTYQDDVFLGAPLKQKINNKYNIAEAPLNQQTGFLIALSSLICNEETTYGRFVEGTSLKNYWHNVYIDGRSLEDIINSDPDLRDDMTTDKEIKCQKLLTDAIFNRKAVDVVGTKTKTIIVTKENGEKEEKLKLVHEIIPVSFKLEGANKKKRDDAYILTHYSSIRRFFDFWPFSIDRKSIERKIREEHMQNQNARHEAILNNRNTVVRDVMLREKDIDCLVGEKDTTRVTDFDALMTDNDLKNLNMGKALKERKIVEKIVDNRLVDRNADIGQNNKLENEIMVLKSFLQDKTPIKKTNLVKQRDELKERKNNLPPAEYERLNKIFQENPNNNNPYKKSSKKKKQKEEDIIDKLIKEEQKNNIVENPSNDEIESTQEEKAEYKDLHKIEKSNQIINDHLKKREINKEIKKLKEKKNEIGNELHENQIVLEDLNKKLIQEADPTKEREKSITKYMKELDIKDEKARDELFIKIKKELVNLKEDPTKEKNATFVLEYMEAIMFGKILTSDIMKIEEKLKEIDYNQNKEVKDLEKQIKDKTDEMLSIDVEMHNERFNNQDPKKEKELLDELDQLDAAYRIKEKELMNLKNNLNSVKNEKRKEKEKETEVFEKVLERRYKGSKTADERRAAYIREQEQLDRFSKEEVYEKYIEPKEALEKADEAYKNEMWEKIDYSRNEIFETSFKVADLRAKLAKNIRENNPEITDEELLNKQKLISNDDVIRLNTPIKMINFITEKENEITTLRTKLNNVLRKNDPKITDEELGEKQKLISNDEVVKLKTTMKMIRFIAEKENELANQKEQMDLSSAFEKNYNPDKDIINDEYLENIKDKVEKEPTNVDIEETEFIK